MNTRLERGNIESSLAQKYSRYSFDNFPFDRLPSINSEVIQGLVEKVSSKTPIQALLLGGRGIDKTHLAGLLVKAAVAAGQTVRWLDGEDFHWTDEKDSIWEPINLQTLTASQVKAAPAIRFDLTNCDLLIINEMPDGLSDENLSGFYQMLIDRKSNGRSNVILSTDGMRHWQTKSIFTPTYRRAIPIPQSDFLALGFGVYVESGTERGFEPFADRIPHLFSYLQFGIFPLEEICRLIAGDPGNFSFLYDKFLLRYKDLDEAVASSWSILAITDSIDRHAPEWQQSHWGVA